MRGWGDWVAWFTVDSEQFAVRKWGQLGAVGRSGSRTAALSDRGRASGGERKANTRGASRLAGQAVHLPREF